MIQELETSECLKILDSNFIGHLAYIFGKSPYVVPVTYFYDAEENFILSYSAKGHKIEAMRKQASIALQVDDIQSIQSWHSILVHGSFEELEGSTAKNNLRMFVEGVQDTIVKSNRAKLRFIQDFSNRLQGKIPIIYRMRISDIIGKFRNYENN